MSRAPASRMPTMAPSGASTPSGAADDFCPVCKSTRYMNKNLRFKMNPICYHKMCSSCVDRIFGHGPATCPIVSCNKTLRKMQFRDQTFEDIAIEREVDIRREVQTVFTKTQEDFETLQDYNNYLEQVEDIAFELVSGIDIEKNRALIESYKREYGDSSKARARREAQEKAATKAAQKETARLDKAAAIREDAQDHDANTQVHVDAVEAIANGTGKSAEIDQYARKKAGGRRNDAVRPTGPVQGANGSAAGLQGSFVLHGLKTRKEQPLEEELQPYDSYGGLYYEPQFFAAERAYDHPEFVHTRRNEKAAAGGFEFAEYASRALAEAFGGLGIFVADEMQGKDAGMAGPDRKMVATEGAALAAGRTRKTPVTMETDDVFG